LLFSLQITSDKKSLTLKNHKSRVACPGIYLLFVERAGRESVRFFFVHFGDVPCGYALAAVWAKQRAMIKGKVNRALNNPVVVHFDKIAFTDFLVVRYEAFAVGAAHLQNVAAPDLSAIGIFIDFHMIPRRQTILTHL